MPNIEMYFVKWVVEWPLIYRNHADLEYIIKQSGFDYCTIINLVGISGGTYEYVTNQI